MPKYVAGIDAGTTGATVMIADLKGNIVGTAYREYPCKFPHPGWVEQDMNLLWKGIAEASKEVLAKTGVDPKEIGSVGFSSQRGTFVGIDKDWNCLHDSIVWSDGRAGEEIDWVAKNIGRDRYHEVSGVPLSGLWAYAKYKWVRDKRPDLYEKAWKFVNGQEWLLHKFGSEELFTDPASLALNGMMDVTTLDWSDELLKAIRVDKDKLPPVKTPMRQVGVVSGRHAHLRRRRRSAVRRDRGGSHSRRLDRDYDRHGLGDGCARGQCEAGPGSLRAVQRSRHPA
jgi:xylulokinase